jgi:hypothetical protein
MAQIPAKITTSAIAAEIAAIAIVIPAVLKDKTA